MKKQILAVCDTEAEYTRRFCNYVSKKTEYPFEVAAFTSREKLRQFCGEEDVDILLISESAYDLSLREVTKGEIVILSNEEGKEQKEQSVYKYQSCETVLKEVMGFYTGKNPESTANRVRNGNLQIIGLFTPVHRCLQTTFAMTLGEVLAKQYKVLYLNFESFSGLERRLNREFMADMSDLIYYISNAREALFYKLKSITETVQRMDYIPPAFSYMDINRVTLQQWILLFQELERLTSYDYLILDLSDNIQGLFDILRMCRKVFTMVREDDMARWKLYQYEKLLERTDYQDVWKKTRQCRLPLIRNISFDMQQLTYGELADYVKKLVKEELYGEP